MRATMAAPTHAAFAQACSPANHTSWILSQLSPDSERYLATAPGRLDVIGGIAEYSGALVVAAPLADYACVGVQRRADGKLRVSHMVDHGNGDARVLEIPLSYLRDPDQSWMNGRRARRELAFSDDMTACGIATVVEAFRERLFTPLENGLSVAVATSFDESCLVSSYAAVSSALMVGMAGLAQEIIEPNRAAQIAQAVENHWLGAPVGPSGSLCGLIGQANHFVHLRCDSRTLAGALRLPEGLRVVAIECAACPPDYDEKSAQVRTATFMGRSLIGRIVQHDGLLAGQWDGHLSRVSVNDFVKHFRDRLPTRMSGQQFLDLFGETGDQLTRIDPAAQYKIRSRTEHHVYEHARSRQFVEAMSRGARNGSRSAFVEAGKALNASHWSMGQRCGMGSVPANFLVNQIRKAGPVKGIFGVRCTGWQCGNTIVALTDDSEAARQVIEDSIQAYIRGYNTAATIRTGSIPGAMVSGAARI